MAIIKRIYQLSDIHIPTYQKLDIYSEQLNKVIKAIRKVDSVYEVNRKK